MEGPSRPDLYVDTGRPAAGGAEIDEDEYAIPGEDYCCEACERIRRRRRQARRREMAAQEAILMARLAASNGDK